MDDTIAPTASRSTLRSLAAPSAGASRGTGGGRGAGVAGAPGGAVGGMHAPAPAAIVPHATAGAPVQGGNRMREGGNRTAPARRSGPEIHF